MATAAIPLGLQDVPYLPLPPRGQRSSREGPPYHQQCDHSHPAVGPPSALARCLARHTAQLECCAAVAPPLHNLPHKFSEDPTHTHRLLPAFGSATATLTPETLHKAPHHHPQGLSSGSGILCQQDYPAGPHIAQTRGPSSPINSPQTGWGPTK